MWTNLTNLHFPEKSDINLHYTEKFLPLMQWRKILSLGTMQISSFIYIMWTILLLINTMQTSLFHTEKSYLTKCIDINMSCLQKSLDKSFLPKYIDKSWLPKSIDKSCLPKCIDKNCLPKLVYNGEKYQRQLLYQQRSNLFSISLHSIQCITEGKYVPWCSTGIFLYTF